MRIVYQNPLMDLISDKLERALRIALKKSNGKANKQPETRLTHFKRAGMGDRRGGTYFYLTVNGHQYALQTTLHPGNNACTACKNIVVTMHSSYDDPRDIAYEILRQLLIAVPAPRNNHRRPVGTHQIFEALPSAMKDQPFFNPPPPEYAFA